MPAAPAAVAVMIYRLIGLWLVLLVGWILFRCHQRRASTASHRASRPAAANLTTSTPTDLGGLHRGPHRPGVRSGHFLRPRVTASPSTLKTLRLACRSRKMSVSTAKLEQRTQDPFPPNGPACQLLPQGGEDPVQTLPDPASVDEAVGQMIYLGLRSLASTDAAAIPNAVKAECLHGYEQAGAMLTAGRAWILGGVHGQQGYPRRCGVQRGRVAEAPDQGDQDGGPRAGGLGRPCRAPGRRAGRAGRGHSGDRIGGPGDLLVDRPAPADCRAAADEILVAAARAGADEWDLAGLAAEIYARSLPEPEDDPEDGFGDREVRLETTFAGAGVIAGDLTPECAAVVGAVLEALSAPMGAQDTRTRAALPRRPARSDAPAGRQWPAARAGRAAGQGCGPHLAGRAARARRRLGPARRVGDRDADPGGPRAETADGGGGDGGAWLDGDAARGVACDAMMIPVVTGEVARRPGRPGPAVRAAGRARCPRARPAGPEPAVGPGR